MVEILGKRLRIIHSRWAYGYDTYEYVYYLIKLCRVIFHKYPKYAKAAAKALSNYVPWDIVVDLIIGYDFAPSRDYIPTFEKNPKRRLEDYDELVYKDLIYIINKELKDIPFEIKHFIYRVIAVEVRNERARKNTR